MTLVLRYAARSDRGLVRANNEDSVYAGARLLALADGMGGHAAGEVASQLVIAALAHLDDDEPGGDLLAKLDTAVRSGNAAIAAQVEAEPELEGMGTTLTAILFAGDRIGLVHIGDSRGYLLRDGELTQITKDDTFVQTLVDEGRITREEAHSHPQRSLIMRALTGHEVEPTLTMREARAGDRYLLCSDGLSDPVSDETILEALQIPDVAEAAYRLIELALRGGGPDNVTVVVADVVDYDYGQTQPILAGAVSGDDDQMTLPNTSAGRASAIRPREEAAKRVAPEPETPSRPRWPRRRMFFAVTLAVLFVLSGLAVGWWVIQRNYYVAEYDGKVSVVRGIQGSLLGVPLQQPYLVGCLSARNELSLISYGQSGHLELSADGAAGSPPSRTGTGSDRTAGRQPGPGRVAVTAIAGRISAAYLPVAARHIAAGVPDHRERHPGVKRRGIANTHRATHHRFFRPHHSSLYQFHRRPRDPLAGGPHHHVADGHRASSASTSTGH